MQLSGKEYLAILRQKDLLWLWFSQVFSAVGDQLYSIAIIWMAVEVGGPAAGYVSAAGAVAGFLAGLVGGVYVDRWNRKKIMIAVDLLRAALVLGLAFLGHAGCLNLYWLALASVLVSGLGAVFDPALTASLPELAGKEERRLQAINALMQTNFRLARTIGPGLAAWLATFAPLHHFFSADALTFAVSALAIFAIGRRYNWLPASGTKGPLSARHVLSEIRRGAEIVLAHPELRWAFPIYIAANMAWSSVFMVGLPLWVKELPGSDAGTYGILIAAYGGGNVISNFIMGAMISKRRMLFISSSQFVFAFGFLIVVLGNNLWLACLGCMLAAVGGPLGDLMLMIMMQTDVKRADLGKVFSIRQSVMYLGCAAGLLLSPLLYEAMGASIGIICGVVLFALAGAAGIMRFGAAESSVLGLLGAGGDNEAPEEIAELASTKARSNLG